MISGRTFENQNVTPKADAGFYQTYSGDGILSGCEMSTTSTALNISAGQMIIAGRIVAIEGSHSIDCSEHLSNDGYLQIALNIDLEQTSTSEQFSQVYPTFSYQTNTTFPELTKGDINYSSDTLYQTELAVLQISGGTIAPTITRQLGKSPIIAEAGIKTAGAILPSNGSPNIGSQNDRFGIVFMKGYNCSEQARVSGRLYADGGIDVPDPSVSQSASATATGVTITSLRQYKIAGATIIDVAGQKTSSAIQSNDYIFRIASAYRPTADFSCWAWVQSTASQTSSIRATANISASTGNITITSAGGSFNYFRFTAIIPQGM